MGKLILSSTLIMLGYAVMAKITGVVFHSVRYIWGLETSLYNRVESVSMSMRQFYVDVIMDGIAEIIVFIGVALFIFLAVNILVENQKGKV